MGNILGFRNFVILNAQTDDKAVRFVRSAEIGPASHTLIYLRVMLLAEAGFSTRPITFKLRNNPLGND